MKCLVFKLNKYKHLAAGGVRESHFYLGGRTPPLSDKYQKQAFQFHEKKDQEDPGSRILICEDPPFHLSKMDLPFLI